MLILPRKMVKTRTLLTALADAILINAAISAAFLIRFALEVPDRNFAAYVYLALPITCIFIVCLYFFGLYDFRRGYSAADTFYNVINAVTLASVFSLALDFVFRDLPFPRTVVFLSWFTNVAALGVWRMMLSGTRRRLIRVLIVGQDGWGRDIKEGLDGSGYVVVGFIDERPGGSADAGVLGCLDDLATIVQKHGVDEMIISPSYKGRALSIIQKCEGMDVRIKVIPELYELASGRTGLDMMGIPFIELDVRPAREGYRNLKRLLDVVFSIYALAITLPFFIAVPLAIKLDSPGPVLYRQVRLGKGGGKFTLLKFRSMVADAEQDTGPALESKGDRRVTRVGRILRRTYLDELPQLFNVLRGDMSLVGPRPERPYFSEKYSEDVKGWYKRLNVVPGMAGLAQLRGGYNLSPEKKLEYDLYYARNQSLWLDVKILVETVLKI